MSDSSTNPPSRGPVPAEPKLDPAVPSGGPSTVGTTSPAPGAAAAKPAEKKDAAEIAQETKADVAAEAKSAATEAHSRGAAVTSEIKSEAEKAAAQARRRAEAAAAEYKDAAASRGQEMAERLRAAGQEFGDGSLPDRYVGQMADSLSNAADALSSKDLGSLMADTASLARRNPGAFIGGAALLGFAAARFLKATAPENRDDGYGAYGEFDDRRYGAASYDPARTPAPAPRPAPGTPVAVTSPAVHAPGKN